MLVNGAYSYSCHMWLQNLATVGDTESEAYIHAKAVRSVLSSGPKLKYHLAG